MFETNEWKHSFFCDVRYENFAFNQEESIFVSYVTKELVHAFICAYIEIWMHLGSLESTQKARVALMLSKLPACTITRYTHAKHEQILNFSVRDFDNAAAECIT